VTDADRIKRLEQAVAVLEEQCFRAWQYGQPFPVREAAARYAQRTGQEMVYRPLEWEQSRG